MESVIATSQQTRGRTADAGLQVIRANDDAAWSGVLADIGAHDVYHLAGYHRLAEHRGEGDAHLFAFRQGGYVLALPLLLRAVDGAGTEGLRDATSVYGYAGPMASDPDIPRRTIEAFQARLTEELQRRQVVAVFSRLHPLIEQDHLIAGLGESRYCGPTVSVDLTMSEEEQWAGYRKGLRRLIRRGREAGITCVHDRDLSLLPEWTTIYMETMERVGALDSYRFDAAYFARMAGELKPALHLFMALVDGQPAAGGMFTICHGIVEAHLGGYREEYAAMPVVRVVDDAARRWATQEGARVFHLGGGLGSQEDSLYRYKATFSDRRHRFKTWQWIIDGGAYEDLCRERAAQLDRSGGADVDQDYFPLYRAPVESPSRPSGDDGPGPGAANERS